MAKKGLIVSRQIGSGRALAEWLCEEKTQQNFSCDILSYASSEQAFLEKKLPVHLVSSLPQQQKLGERMLDPQDYDFLLMGTSLQAEEDSRWILWARENKIPSIAFIDQWINYKQRFYNGIFPDHIFVVDSKAKQGFTDETASIDDARKSKIHVVGSPALNTLLDIKRNPESTPTIHFVTEPSSYVGGDEEYHQIHGINDLEALKYLVGAIEVSPLKKTIHLVIHLHPLEKTNDRVQNFLKSQFEKLSLSVSYKNSSALDKLELLSGARLIVGMRSFLLFEASLLGIPVLSLQVGRKTKSALTDERPSILVLDSASNVTASIQDFIERSLREDKKTGPVLKKENQWTQTILQILKT